VFQRQADRPLPSRHFQFLFHETREVGRNAACPRRQDTQYAYS
jgi:hypothetical protein